MTTEVKQQFFVEIIHTSTGVVDRRIGPLSKARADHVEDGVNINLNHDKYHTRTVPAGDVE